MAEEMNVTAGGGTGVEADTQTATSTDTANGQVQNEKMYTQAEVKSLSDQMVTKALATAKTNWEKGLEERIQNERDEATRLAKLSAEERAKEEFKKEREAFAEERSKHNAERLQFECSKQLNETGLPVSFAKLLTGTDAEATAANIKTFKEEFDKAVQAGVEQRVKGKAPSTGGGTTETDPFLKGFGG